MMLDARRNRNSFQFYFLRGLTIGLLGTISLGSFVALWRTEGHLHSPPRRAGNFDGSSQTVRKGFGSRKKILAFVGVQTGFTRNFQNPKYIYELRREALRKTWFPKSQAQLQKLEKESGVVIRFIMGHSDDESKEWNAQVEEKRHNDFLRLDMHEDYLNLVDKTLLFFRTVVERYDAKYIIKVDDDVYFRLDRIPYAVRQWEIQHSDYVGCMKRGPVFTSPKERWHEPQHDIIGPNYFTHAWGTAYALSGRAASLLARIPTGTLRFLNNEDTSIGAWMLGLNVTHYDDRRMCSAHCTDSSIAVYDIPKCAGLCDPQGELSQLHVMADCKGPAVPDGHDSVPMEPEIYSLGGVTSRKSVLT